MMLSLIMLVMICDMLIFYGQWDNRKKNAGKWLYIAICQHFWFGTMVGQPQTIGTIEIMPHSEQRTRQGVQAMRHVPQ